MCISVWSLFIGKHLCPSRPHPLVLAIRQRQGREFAKALTCMPCGSDLWGRLLANGEPWWSLNLFGTKQREAVLNWRWWKDLLGRLEDGLLWAGPC